MNTVTVKTLPGETKYAAILRLLGARSVAQAIEKNGLQNFEGDIWAKLESLAAQQVQVDRSAAKVSRVLRNLRRSF